MSKGPGLWQRLILQQLASDVGFPLREFWRLVKPKRGPWTPAEYSALNRAAHVLAKKGGCQLLHADDIESGVQRQSQNDQIILFVARMGASIKTMRRPRSTTRQWVTTFSLDGANGAEWIHDPTYEPAGNTWSRAHATSSGGGRTSDASEGDHWYARKRKSVLVREPGVDWLEAFVGLGGSVSEKERAERLRLARRMIGQADQDDYPRVDPEEKPFPRGDWEHLLPSKLTGEQTRAVALAIIYVGINLGGTLARREIGPTVKRLQELAGGSLKRSLRRLARSGYLYIDDRDQLFILRGSEIPGPEPRHVHTRRAIDRLDAILGARDAHTGTGIVLVEAGTAELLAEITAESISVEALREVAGG